MADNRKEQEREELHRTIWSIANGLRGSVDGWAFKQYVLGMLFNATFPRTSPTTSTRASARPTTPTSTERTMRCGAGADRGRCSAKQPQATRSMGAAWEQQYQTAAALFAEGNYKEAAELAEDIPESIAEQPALLTVAKAGTALNTNTENSFREGIRLLENAA